jgi:hypothetical protein
LVSLSLRAGNCSESNSAHKVARQPESRFPGIDFLRCPALLFTAAFSLGSD